MYDFDAWTPKVSPYTTTCRVTATEKPPRRNTPSPGWVTRGWQVSWLAGQHPTTPPSQDKVVPVASWGVDSPLTVAGAAAD
jgi:hypothetical protein